MPTRSDLALRLLTVLLASACGGGSPSPAEGGDAKLDGKKVDPKAAANAVAAVEAATDEARFKEPFEKEACKLFTPALVATALGVAETDLKEQVSGCRYSWGRSSHAHLWWPKVADSPAKALAAFEREHKPKSGAQIKQDMKAIQKQLEKQKQQGDERFKDVDEKQAKQVGGAVAGALSAGMDYDVVEGVGDKAYWHNKERVMNIGGTEIKNYDNKLDVCVDNLSFQIEVHLDERRPTKDEAIKLAKAFMEKLP